MLTATCFLRFTSSLTFQLEPPEALFRSLTLVFFDNACSEYTFLVRYFEALPHKRTRFAKTSAGSDVDSHEPMSPRTSNPPTPLTEIPETGLFDADDTFAPSEVATAISDPHHTMRADADEADEGDLVQLSGAEQVALKGRGAADEMFKKVFEPVIGTWIAFSRSLLTPTPPALLPLLCMMQLTDQLLNLATIRGCASVLTGPLLQFKMDAWPVFQKRFQEDIEAIQLLTGDGEGPAGSTSSSANASFTGWMRSATAGALAGVGMGGKTSVTEDGAVTIASRYAGLYSRIAHLSSSARLPEKRKVGA